MMWLQQGLDFMFSLHTYWVNYVALPVPILEKADKFDYEEILQA